MKTSQTSLKLAQKHKLRKHFRFETGTSDFDFRIFFFEKITSKATLWYLIFLISMMFDYKWPLMTLKLTKYYVLLKSFSRKHAYAKNLPVKIWLSLNLYLNWWPQVTQNDPFTIFLIKCRRSCHFGRYLKCVRKCVAKSYTVKI